MKVWVLVAIGALGIGLAACGGSSDNKATSSPTASVAETVPATSAAAPTEQATAATTESYSDFDAQSQRFIDQICSWAKYTEAGDRADNPVPGDLDLEKNFVLSGRAGETLAQHGEEFAAAVTSRNASDLTAAATDISADCEAIGWTPSS